MIRPILLNLNLQACLLVFLFSAMLRTACSCSLQAGMFPDGLISEHTLFMIISKGTV